MEKIEQKLNLEREITQLNRDRKISIANLETLKEETGLVEKLLARKKKEIEEAEIQLQEVTVDTEQKRLEFLNFKSQEEQKLQDKEKEILKKEQEAEKIIKKEQEVIKKNNELKEELKVKRQLELKLQDDQIKLDIRARELEDREKDIDTQEKLLEAKINAIKQSAMKVINEINEL